jgi:hypothetical protein
MDVFARLRPARLVQQKLLPENWKRPRLVPTEPRPNLARSKISFRRP